MKKFVMGVSLVLTLAIGGVSLMASAPKAEPKVENFGGGGDYFPYGNEVYTYYYRTADKSGPISALKVRNCHGATHTFGMPTPYFTVVISPCN